MYICSYVCRTFSTPKDCEIENKQLRETLEEYNSEFAHVKNQGGHMCTMLHFCESIFCMYVRMCV